MGWEKCKGAMLSIVLVRGVRGPKSGKAMKIKKKKWTATHFNSFREIFGRSIFGTHGMLNFLYQYMLEGTSLAVA